MSSMDNSVVGRYARITCGVHGGEGGTIMRVLFGSRVAYIMFDDGSGAWVPPECLDLYAFPSAKVDVRLDKINET